MFKKQLEGLPFVQFHQIRNLIVNDSEQIVSRKKGQIILIDKIDQKKCLKEGFLSAFPKELLL